MTSNGLANMIVVGWIVSWNTLRTRSMCLVDSESYELLTTTIHSQDLRTQLVQERESVRRLTLQRDIELKELQGKAEKAVCCHPRKWPW